MAISARIGHAPWSLDSKNISAYQRTSFLSACLRDKRVVRRARVAVFKTATVPHEGPQLTHDERMVLAENKNVDHSRPRLGHIELTRSASTLPSTNPDKDGSGWAECTSHPAVGEGVHSVCLVRSDDCWGAAEARQ